ncbi:MAG: hypothetical protein K2X44_04740, partial [Magnetospirillum sp.]|nr:hypothetical protein [Magnetospirillum sp.]
SNWMGDLMAAYPQAKNAEFQQFALAGAHDAGMFTLSTVNSILSSPYAAGLLGALTIIPVIGPVIATAGAISLAQAPRAITNLALTQKDNITTMLNLGIRYFDFRPGTLYSAIAGFNPGVRYHQHAVIPGYPYISFLQDVLTWLSQHPSEIVVVSANTQGIVEASMDPTAADLASDLTTAFTNAGLTGKIGTGDSSSLGQTYAQLIASNTRLIFLNQISTPPETSKYDSYNVPGANYNTNVPASIISAFQSMTAQGQAGSTYTVMQMQGTATGMGATVIVPAIATLSDASSPLMSTKADFDINTNPWLLNNVSKTLTANQLMVFLNDFVDNCMVSTAIGVTKQRMGLS